MMRRSSVRFFVLLLAKLKRRFSGAETLQERGAHVALRKSQILISDTKKIKYVINDVYICFRFVPSRRQATTCFERATLSACSFELPSGWKARRNLRHTHRQG